MIKSKGKSGWGIKRHILALAILCSAIAVLSALPASVSEGTLPASQRFQEQQVTLIFAGDIMQHMPQVEAAWNQDAGRYSYDSCFRYISPWLSGADIAVANLETTLAGKPYSGYPAFSSPDELVNGLLNAGIDVVGTANNHCCDRGRTGIERTIQVLDSLKMRHMGTYSDIDSASKNHPLIIRKNGFKLALLNYTYGTNGNVVPEGNVVNLIENERVILDIAAARRQAVDKTIVFIHWGDEYMREPGNFQKETAQFLFDSGADIIIGSHPHVIQPMQWYKADSLHPERLVVWSLGNCVSNQRKRYTDGGAMFRLTLRKSGNETTIADAGYLLTWVYNPVENGRKQYYILSAARYESDTLLPDGTTNMGLRLFLHDSRELLGAENLNVNEIVPE